MGQERASKPCADCLRLGIVDRVAFLLTAVLYVSGSPVYSSTDQSLFKVWMPPPYMVKPVVVVVVVVTHVK